MHLGLAAPPHQEGPAAAPHLGRGPDKSFAVCLPAFRSFRRPRVRVYLFVATLGYSRRVYARTFRHARQSAWFEGLEGGFWHFGGLPKEVLLDNAKALPRTPKAGWAVNAKRVWRLYRLEDLQLRSRTPKRRASAKLRQDRAVASAPNEIWAMDFLSDQLTSHGFTSLAEPVV